VPKKGTPGRSVICVNCAVERVLGRPTATRTMGPLLVNRGTLVAAVSQRRNMVPKGHK